MASVVILSWVLAMVVLNAVFVAAEFAPIAAPRATIDAMANDGNRLARMLQPVLHDAGRMDRYIATVQLGITLATVGLGMYGEHRLSALLLGAFGDAGVGTAEAHALASAVVLVGMTYVHVVVGEMVPKSIALATPVRVALWLAPVIAAFRVVLFPLVYLTERASGLALRLLGIDRDAAHVSRYYTSEDLHDVVDESEETGALSPESSQVLRDLLEFPERTAEEVMVPRVRMIGIPVGATPVQVAEILRRSRHTRHPVYEGDLDHIVGGIHVKKLYRDHLVARAPVTRESARVMPFVPEAARLDKVLDAMRENGVHMAFVMDEHGGTAGMITVEDLFEEVVGEIDEGGSVPPIVDEPDGSVIVAGTVRLDELGEHVELELEHEDADTVSGLVLLLLGRPARVGDRVEFGGLQFTVRAVANRGVRRCQVRRLPAPAVAE
ncbi:MAG: hemolysin family protein [Planctomycetota bacterium]